eukprot:scaffold164112_cov23-Tisochrysis_lutea.AAC.1
MQMLCQHSREWHREFLSSISAVYPVFYMVAVSTPTGAMPAEPLRSGRRWPASACMPTWPQAPLLSCMRCHRPEQ